MATQTPPILSVRNLKKYFPITKGLFKKSVGAVRAVDDVTFEVEKGHSFGLVGESGCGKTTLGRCYSTGIEPTCGKVKFTVEGQEVDFTELDEKGLKKMRQHVQLIFQDPYSSLNARMIIKDIVSEPLVVNHICPKSEIESRVGELLKKVGLLPEYMYKYPHAFSGGQRQRVGIARALALNPDFVVCDEPVSALDVSVQAQVLNLLCELKEELHLSYLFISHDMSVVRHICDRVAVMYVGRMVEIADTNDLFVHPRHPYTEALMSSIPVPDPRFESRQILLPGEVADPSNAPPGCAFRVVRNRQGAARPAGRALRPDGPRAGGHVRHAHRPRGDHKNLRGARAAAGGGRCAGSVRRGNRGRDTGEGTGNFDVL